MSEENVELVRQVYEAYNRDDLQWVLDRCAPDVELRPNAGLADLDEVYRGHEGVRAWYRAWREAWDFLSYRVERIEGLDDRRVLVLVMVSGKGRDSGVVVEDRRGHLCEFEAGLCTRWQSFATWDQALEAAGLSE
jgi:ketosteroid isomerase-like protein